MNPSPKSVVVGPSAFPHSLFNSVVSMFVLWRNLTIGLACTFIHTRICMYMCVYTFWGYQLQTMQRGITFQLLLCFLHHWHIWPSSVDSATPVHNLLPVIQEYLQYKFTLPFYPCIIFLHFTYFSPAKLDHLFFLKKKVLCTFLFS